MLRRFDCEPGLDKAGREENRGKGGTTESEVEGSDRRSESEDEEGEGA